MNNISKCLLINVAIVLNCFVYSQESANITLINQWSETSCLNVEVVGDYLYLSESDHEIAILDISDPGNLIKVGSFHVQEGHTINDLERYGDFLYLLEDSLGNNDDVLHILDISDASNPVEVGELILSVACFDSFCKANELAIKDSTLLTSGQNENYPMISIYNISDPIAPEELGHSSWNECSSNLNIVEEYLYRSCWGGIVIVDISDVDNFQTVGEWNCGCNATGAITLHNGYAYVEDVNSDTLSILDLADPINPIQTGVWFHEYETLESFTYGAYIYMATELSGIRLFDIQNPLEPVEVGNFNSGIQFPEASDRVLAVKDDYCYIAAGDQGLYVIQYSPLVTIETQTILYSKFALLQNYPNPFNPVTTIHFDLPEHSEVSLTIYDVQGREITTLINTTRNAGTHKVLWNGLDDSGIQVSTGVYLCRFNTDNYSKTIKMLYLK